MKSRKVYLKGFGFVKSMYVYFERQISKGNQILAVQKCQAEYNIDRDAGEIRIFHYKSMKAGLKMERSVLINLG